MKATEIVEASMNTYIFKTGLISHCIKNNLFLLHKKPLQQSKPVAKDPLN